MRHTKPGQHTTSGVLTPLRIVLIYLLIGGVWILFSDALLFALTHNPTIDKQWSTIKGLFYIVVTAALLYVLIQHHEATLNNTQQQLLKREEEFRRVIETAQEGIWICDVAGETTYLNTRLAELLGYPPDTILGKPLLQFTDPVDCSMVEQQLSLVRAGQSARFDLRLLRQDGTPIWVIVSVSPIFTDAHAFNGLLAMITDITERKRAEDERDVERRQLESVFSQAPVGLLLTDRNLHIHYLNVNAATGAGTAPDAQIGQSIEAFLCGNLPAEQAQLLLGHIVTVFKTGNPHTERNLASNWAALAPKVSYADWEIRRVTQVSGRVLGLLLTMVDVTQQKTAAEALLSESAFLASAIELLPFPIIFNSPSGQVLRANQASFHFFRETDSARWWSSVQLFTADTHVPVPMEQWPMMRSARGEVVPALESTITFADGREVPILAYATPVYVNERLVASAVALQDVTALKEADRAKNQFLDVLSHELKTPLTSILGWTQAAEDDPSIIPQALHIIENNAQRQRHMLNDLIDVSRLLHGKLMMIRERTQLWPLVMQAVVTMRPSLAEHNITLTVLPPVQPLPVDADPARVVQVVWNLLSNAGKFTEPGGEITVTAQREERQAVLIIRDTGRGIATEDLAILFQPFRQIERTEKAGGIGIGLMLVKGIVELHGGSIFAASPGPGQGSTFTVILPLAE